MLWALCDFIAHEKAALRGGFSFGTTARDAGALRVGDDLKRL